MTKTQMKRLINECIQQKKICNVYFRYDPCYWNLIPLKADNQLFLSVKEDDFILNGYTVRRFRDMKKVKAKDDMCGRILALEGITDTIETPDIDINDWKTVFESLKQTGKNINSNGCTIYYDASNTANAWLNGATITLSGGGTLTPMA